MRYRNRLFQIVSLVLLLAFPTILIAQVELTQTYTSADGMLTMNYPEGWLLDEERDDVVGFYGDGALFQVSFYDNSTSGYAPITALEFLEVGIGRAPDRFLGFSEPEELVFGGYPALLSRSSQASQLNTVIDFGGGMLGKLIGFAPGGELATFEPTFMAMLESIRYGEGAAPVVETPAGNITLTTAQTDCPTIVQTALEAADTVCQSIGRNQACYGNVLVNAQPQPGLEGFSFDQSGDIVNVVDVLSLQLESLDEESGAWGVALMRLQANLPDTLPGQNVTFILFGNVEIENAVAPAPQPVLLDVTAAGNANVRGEPSTNGAIVGSLSGSQSVTADGRNEAGDWLHIQLDDGTGWVFADLVTVDGEVNSLLVVEGGEVVSSQKPMQSFYFRSGFGDSPCAEAPDSGILIQTPEGAGQVALTINGVDIQLGSTAYLQAQPSEQMIVNLVEGSAQVSAEGTTQIVSAGTRVNVPIDANLQASGPPGEPEPYDNANLEALPVTLLEREIEVAPALTQEEIDALTNLVPVSGTWAYQAGQPSFSSGCSPELAQSVTVTTVPVTIDFTEGFTYESIWAASGDTVPAGAKLENPAPGLYTADVSVEGIPLHWETQFLSPTQAEGFMTFEFEGCVITAPWTLNAQ